MAFDSPVGVVNPVLEFMYGKIYREESMIRHLYILWFQGFDQAPEIVQACVQSWIVMNPTWTVHLLDDTTWPNMVSLGGITKDERGINAANFSDLVRIALLDQRGGIWVDATTFCTQPLDEWLPECIEQGFFAFDRPAKDRMLSSWFLYAEPGNYIVKKWCQAMIAFYRNKPRDKKPPYFIFHYLFADLYKADTRFRQMWDAVPKRSADGPHSLQAVLLDPMDDRIRQTIQEQPLFKLTHHKDLSQYSDDSVLAHLYARNHKSFSPHSNETDMITEGFETPSWVYSTGITNVNGMALFEILLIVMTCIVLAAATIMQAMVPSSPLGPSTAPASPLSSLFSSKRISGGKKKSKQSH